MKLFAQNDAAAFVRTGAREFRFNRDIRLTPGARDVLIEAGIKVVFDANASVPTGAAPAAPAKSEAAAAPAATPAYSGGKVDVQALFNSPEAKRLKEEICEMGRRCWQRDYNDANGGNLSARLGDYFLCTPTLVSKGFMKPEMICLVDIDGNQVAGNGKWRRTSEIMSHLGIYKMVPAAASVVHAHPIHATAFAMAGIEPPQCLIPEVEVFVGTIPVAEYKTPGSPQMSEILGKLAPKHQAILMGNHGVITWGTSVEDAYFKMEITDSYCRTLWVAAQLPTKRTTIPPDEVKKLLDMKEKMGLPDARHGLKAAQLCDCDPWDQIGDRPQACATPAGKAASVDTMTNAELESMVQKLTEQVMSALKK
ncbi:class II aldolase/adducin family protein [Opitutus sp. ER46]|uniref:class II aldolase/adducin family protein n=1 Tax=Opitutus sp. ER46 TaxID=2161864 RepID=UPI000D30F7AD|nr:class II aldolase/adducin family protein [Opitutus sp. ER46]PTX97869.1 class II aldolase family protein [Opitutus sp. ER46]